MARQLGIVFLVTVVPVLQVGLSSALTRCWNTAQPSTSWGRITVISFVLWMVLDVGIAAPNNGIELVGPLSVTLAFECYYL